MKWEELLTSARTGRSTPHVASLRSEFERDADRLIFSPPFRRLQNKTQVFPLPGPVFVHNRLTHSLEVSSVGRSLAREVSARLGQRHPELAPLLEALPPIVQAACLAHDLGNPPFGHSGERAIQHYFEVGPGRDRRDDYTPDEWADLVRYDGNANTFRLLAHTFAGRRQGGFALTCATLAATVKYPRPASSCPDGKRKFGFFVQDAPTYSALAERLGIPEVAPGQWARHPLVYLVEAADDICYQACDLEDATRLGLVDPDTARRLFTDMLNPGQDIADKMRDVMRQVTDKHEQMAYLRTCFIGCLVQRAAEAFDDAEQELLDGRFQGTLLDRLPDEEATAFDNLRDFALQHIYHHQSVAQVELTGFQIIGTLLDKFMRALDHPEQYYSSLVLPFVAEQFRVAPDAGPYDRTMCALDTVAGMTDLYALSLFRKVTGAKIE